MTQIINLSEKVIKGKKIRVNNQTPEAIIELWREVPDMELEGDVFAVYSNFQSDFTGDYDLTIGNEGSKLKDQVAILEGAYLTYEVAGMEKVVGAWQKIWQDAALNERRAYLTDFEHYTADGQVKIYLSIKA